MASKYQETERARAENLIKSGNPVFYGGKAGKYFMTKNRDFVLQENLKNLYAPICNDVIEYFKSNLISWWGGRRPTGHVLSSQIACVNHLFQIRLDKSAVLTILKNVSNDFVDVFQINTDKYLPAYIQFESVSDKDYLNEGQPTRGNNCTSVDALIYAKHKDGSKWIIPIEWKYTEFYNNQNKAIEGYKADPLNCKGEVRKKRYTDLINNSNQLINIVHSCFYFEPFYQLMRQTLWAEQVIKNKDFETIKADNYLHVHVIPLENKDLLDKEYKCSGLGMESTWKNHLVNKDKYVIISPKDLLRNINKEKYNDLCRYLNERYWDKE
ncbi:MAG: PGN_0703 family putative restriction endonuclease [Lutibacter sp.]